MFMFLTEERGRAVFHESSLSPENKGVREPLLYSFFQPLYSRVPPPPLATNRHLRMHCVLERKDCFLMLTALTYSPTSCLRNKKQVILHQHCVGRKKYSPSCRRLQMLGLCRAKWVKGQSHTHSLGCSGWQQSQQGEVQQVKGHCCRPAGTFHVSAFRHLVSVHGNRAYQGKGHTEQRQLYHNPGLPLHCVQGRRPSAQASWPLGILLLKWKNRDCKVLARSSCTECGKPI